LALGLALSASPVAAAETPLPPSPTRWVTDNAGLLSPAARASLDARLEAYEHESGHQILVWIGTTLGDVPLDDFAVKALRAWGVGRKGVDDGLIILVFAQDHRVRIEVGYGLEERVPDAIASRIIRETMAPRLAAGDADGALSAGVQATLAAISGETAPIAPTAEATPTTAVGYRHQAPSLAQKIIVAVLILGFLVLLVTHPGMAIWLLLNILTSGGSGGGSGGGGGGFSGGGGRSGGGGASGSW
jgi:uncharacterized protein